ncbi:serine/threonine-protein kinase [Streptomyces sp. NPDC052052]|uniref:serine/threonine-protein kinase n=1 Tax=Streptomyces sp. NPDC052052 TaxID=3154756 RepID=UPI0034350DD9
MDVLEPGDPPRIGDFTLIGRLGVGGMGQVFLGRSSGGRAVAVKVVKAALAEDPEFRARFRREVAALHRVGGAWTTPVLGSDTEAAAPWVATEYVPGPSLHQVVESGYGPLPEATLHALAGQLARTLSAVHGAGLVHRDLKPSNILLTVDGPRVIDFGIVRALDTVAGTLRTSTGVVLGSPGFMSPEQVRGQRVTPAADMFSLGSVLVYAATGRLPFGSADLGAHTLMFRIAAEEPDLTGVPHTLTGLVSACLAKDPEQRPTAEQVAVGTRTDSDAPWLPAELLAELGRLAARMLTAETPPQGAPAQVTPSPPGTPTPHTPPHDTPAPAPAPGTPPQGAPAPAPSNRPRSKPRWRPVLAGVLALAAAATGTALALRGIGIGEKGPTAGGASSATTPASGSTASGAQGVPEDFVGAWEGVLDGNVEMPKRVLRLEISSGEPGEKVATYIDTDGDLQCTGRSELVSADADMLVIDQGQVTAGVPEGRCTPLARQTLRVKSRDVLVFTSGSVTADFYRSTGGRAAVPEEYVGAWVPVNEFYREQEMIRITQGPVGGRLVRLAVTAGTENGTDQYCDGTFVVGAVSPVLALSPAVYTAESGQECRQPDAVFLTVADDHLMLYSMNANAEPAEYIRKS